MRGGSGPPPSAAASTALSAPSSSPPSSAASPATQPADLFFTSGGKLSAVPSRVSGTAPARQALEQLLKGPTDAQHVTEIPTSTHLQDVSIKNGTATVSFDDAFFAPDGATGTLLRLAQVVFTLTQFSGVTSVRFLQDGRGVDLIGEGFPLNRPLARQDFAHVQP
ncbi:MAG TPA: GerMN domain-containing protein [Chloroflexota bacterium]